MILDDINLQQVEVRVYELDKKIEELRKIEAERNTLLKYREVVYEYKRRKARAESRLATAQDKKAVSWFAQFPFIALDIGEENIQRQLSKYINPKSEALYTKPRAESYKISGKENEIYSYLQQFVDEEKRQKPKPYQHTKTAKAELAQVDKKGARELGRETVEV